MRRSLLTLTLASALVCAGLSDARPRRPAPPTTLSAAEAVCQALGIFAYNRALDRDAGWSLFVVLDYWRQWDRANAVLPSTQRLHDDIIHAVYATPALHPVRAQQHTEAL